MIDLNEYGQDDIIPIGIHYKLYPMMPFGKHGGELINRLPVKYLQWMAKSSLGYHMNMLAQAALRGDVEPPELENCVLLRAYNEREMVIDAPFDLKDEIKGIDGARWSPDDRVWLIPIRSATVVRRMYPNASVGSRYISQKVNETFAKQTTLF